MTQTVVSIPLRWIVAIGSLLGISLALAVWGLARHYDRSQAQLLLAVAHLSDRVDALDANRSDTPSLRQRRDQVSGGHGGGAASAGMRKGLLGEGLLPDAPGAPTVDPNAIARELDGLHVRDQADPGSGHKAEAQLEAFAAEPALVANKLIPSELQTDCRSSRCRMVAKFPRRGDAEDWAIMLTTLSGSVLSYARIVQLPMPDGSAEVRIYGARR